MTVIKYKHKWFLIIKPSYLIKPGISVKSIWQFLMQLGGQNIVFSTNVDTFPFYFGKK